MKDITGLMNDHRECIRHVWNTHCLKVMEKGDWDFRDLINGIEIDLFRALVLYKLEREDTVLKPAQWQPEEVLLFLKVETESRAAILINREKGNSSGCWDDPVKYFEKGDLDLRFIHYFDWNVLGFRDFAFYRVRIIGSQKYPHLIGRNALVPVETGVVVLYDENA